jgi:hypothetical protein
VVPTAAASVGSVATELLDFLNSVTSFLQADLLVLIQSEINKLLIENKF